MQRLIDWWRGYTEADVLSLQDKVGVPGALDNLTLAEYKALLAGRADFTKRPKRE